MTAIGPFLFGAPLALLMVLALPLLLFILRATPPPPRQIELPSVRILEGISPRDETPRAHPGGSGCCVSRPRSPRSSACRNRSMRRKPSRAQRSSGALLIVIDNGWPSATRWSELINAAEATLDTGGRDAPVHLLLTAPQALNVDPAERLSKTDAGRRLSTLRPHSWNTDRTDALTRLDASGLKPQRIFYASDGLE